MRAPSTKIVQQYIKNLKFWSLFGPFSAVNLKKAIPHPTVWWSVSEVIRKDERVIGQPQPVAAAHGVNLNHNSLLHCGLQLLRPSCWKKAAL